MPRAVHFDVAGALQDHEDLVIIAVDVVALGVSALAGFLEAHPAAADVSARHDAAQEMSPAARAGEVLDAVEFHGRSFPRGNRPRRAA